MLISKLKEGSIYIDDLGFHNRIIKNRHHLINGHWCVPVATVYHLYLKTERPIFCDVDVEEVVQLNLF